MKLVLKHNQTVKLYTDQLKYKELTNFISVQMGLVRQSIEITYTDQDGDEIYLGDDSDLQVLASLTNEKSYVKINVKGNLRNEPLKKDNLSDIAQIKDKNSLQFSVQKAKIQEKTALKDQPPKESNPKQAKLEKKVKITQQEKKEKREKPKEKQQKEKKQPKKEKNQEVKLTELSQFKKFSELMTSTINSIVGQRLQAIVSQIRNQNKQKSPNNNQKAQAFIHEGYECQNCGVSPIIGIRYECPKCLHFSICEKCQEFNSHEHNMLKIRKQESKDVQKAKIIKKNLKKLYTLLNPDKNKNQRKEISKEDQEVHRMSKHLKKIFGGKVQTYIPFIEKHRNLELNQLIEKLCEQNGLKVQYIRIQEKPKKAQSCHPNDDNLKIELQKSSQAQVIKSQVKKIFFPKTKSIEYEEIEVPASLKETLEERIEISEKRKEDIPKKELQIQEEVEKRTFIQGITQQNMQIYKSMVQFIGEERASEYPQFIKEHPKQGKDNIIILWYNQFSVKEQKR